MDKSSTLLVQPYHCLALQIVHCFYVQFIPLFFIKFLKYLTRDHLQMIPCVMAGIEVKNISKSKFLLPILSIPQPQHLYQTTVHTGDQYLPMAYSVCRHKHVTFRIRLLQVQMNYNFSVQTSIAG